MDTSQQQQRDVNRIILWSVGILAVVVLVGLIAWSQAGAAVFFDRISGAIVGCF